MANQSDFERYMTELDHFDTTHIQPASDIVDEFSYPIKAFMTLITKVEEQYAHYTQLLSFCDCAREDITHYMEFNRMSAADRAKLTNKLIDVLHVRRAIKTRLQCIQILRDGWFAEQGTNLYQRAAKVMATLKSADSLGYNERTSVLDDIFGGGESAVS